MRVQDQLAIVDGLQMVKDQNQAKLHDDQQGDRPMQQSQYSWIVHGRGPRQALKLLNVNSQFHLGMNGAGDLERAGLDERCRKALTWLLQTAIERHAVAA